MDSYETDKAFTPFSCLLRLNNLFPLIKNRSNKLQNQFNKIYHRKYTMYTPIILNGLCNNHTIFIAIVSFICKVIEGKWTKKKIKSLEHIPNASKYPCGINLIYKNSCQSDLKEMTSWGSTYFFSFLW